MHYPSTDVHSKVRVVNSDHRVALPITSYKINWLVHKL